MGRKKKSQVRGTVSFRLLPDIEEAVKASADRWRMSKSSAIQKLVRHGLETVETENDATLSKLVLLWPRLPLSARGDLLSMVESLLRVHHSLEELPKEQSVPIADSAPAPPPADPYEGGLFGDVNEYDDLPPKRH